VSYGPVRAVRNVSLTVAEGEAVALIGANGAGKSSLLRAISGLMKPVGGSVFFRGADVTGIEPFRLARAGMAHVPEGRRVFARMTVRENLLVGAYATQGQVKQGFERVYALFPRLCERERQLAATLSGGEQQMLAIARALMSRPRLLLMDEPSLGLSPRLTRLVFRTIGDLHSEGTSLLLVEQNARQALRLASRGYVLKAGELQLSGSSQTLATDPRIQEMYLGTHPVIVPGSKDTPSTCSSALGGERASDQITSKEIQP
jgi:branched-chain amino acid transport system ATP-binding protein